MAQVAEDINREVGKRADAVRRIKNAVVDSLAEGERPSRPKCCEDNVDFTVDPRFPGEVTYIANSLIGLRQIFQVTQQGA